MNYLLKWSLISCLMLLPPSSQAQDAKSRDSFLKDLARLSGKEKVKAQNNKGSTDEKFVYSSLIEAYQRGLLSKASQLQQTLVKEHPQSVYSDNAYYLLGLLHFEKGYYSQAMKLFNDLLDKYPMGNKRAAALYAKAATYRRLNLAKFEQDLLKQIIKLYPGSVEAKRSVMDLALQQSSK